MAFKIFFGNPPTVPVVITLRPDADVSDGTWLGQDGGTSLYTYIDEVLVDDADYIISSNSVVNDVCVVSLSNPTGTVGQPVDVSYRYAKVGSDRGDLKVRLLQTSTEIAVWSHDDISTTPTTVTQTLTTPQFALITDFNALRLEFTANPTTTVTASNGMSWTFRGVVTHGTYVNGDVWVYTTTTLAFPTLSTPATGAGASVRNGGMINPTFNTLVEIGVMGHGYSATMKQGFDGRAFETNVLDYSDAYNAHLSASTLSPGDSLVSCESLNEAEGSIAGGNKRCIWRMGCVTVVNYIPEADEFRPPYFGTTKTRWRWSDADLSILPNLTAAFNPKGTAFEDWHIDASSIYVGSDTTTRPLMTSEQYMRVSSCVDLQWLICPNDSAKSSFSMLRPATNMSWYPRDQVGSYSKLACYVLHNFSDRDIFLKRLIQIAIDAYAVAIGFSGRAPYSCGAGFFATPLWLVRFAGLLFDDAGMKDAANIPTGKVDFFGDTCYKWGEQTRTFFSATAGAAYLLPPGYVGDYPLFGDQPFQDNSATQGGVGSNGTFRYPGLIYDVYPYHDQAAFKYGIVGANSVNGTTLQLKAYAPGEIHDADDVYNGCPIEAQLDGTYYSSVITDYVGSTRVCTVSPAFPVVPDNDDRYWIYHTTFPTIISQLYKDLPDPNTPGVIGAYMSANQWCTMGCFMASIIMGDEAFWGGNGSIQAFNRRHANDRRMWESFGDDFDDNTSDAAIRARRDQKGFGGNGNGWMADLGDSIL